MIWNKINKGESDLRSGTPGCEGSDEYYLVMLHGKFMAISYFFVDSFGYWWSSQWDVWDKYYSGGEVTDWAELPDTPNYIVGD